MRNNVISYDDILLVPQKSDISTRDDIDVGVDFPKFRLRVPILSSPMDTVTAEEMALRMQECGGLGILHRYNTVPQQVTMFKKTKQSTTPDTVASGTAVGITGDYQKRVESLYDVGCRLFCFDVAHGHHAMMEAAVKWTRDRYADDCTIIAGNVATANAFSDLASWGADAIRVGIGGGSICSTRIQTGHGLPTLYSVMVCSAQRELEDLDTLIIADGGIRNAGDIVKSIALGADCVMLGSLLAGTDETPGQVITSLDGTKNKIYRGMASREAQEGWRGSARSVEGVSSTVPCRGPVATVIEELAFNIKSGFSYSGARNISEMQTRAMMVTQTSASQIESQTHILLRGT